MVLQKSFLSLQNFLAQKCKNQSLEFIIFQSEVHVISNPSSRLEKTSNPWIFAYELFKKDHFRIFQYFQK